jgi:glutathione S-transferase
MVSISDFTFNRIIVFPYKQLPVLEVNGKYLAQSYSILRFLSDELGMYFYLIRDNFDILGLAGEDKWERAKLDELMELLHEPYADIYAYYGTIWKYGEGDRVWN